MFLLAAGLPVATGQFGLAQRQGVRKSKRRRRRRGRYRRRKRREESQHYCPTEETKKQKR